MEVVVTTANFWHPVKDARTFRPAKEGVCTLRRGHCTLKQPPLGQWPHMVGGSHLASPRAGLARRKRSPYGSTPPPKVSMGTVSSILGPSIQGRPDTALPQGDPPPRSVQRRRASLRVCACVWRRPGPKPTHPRPPASRTGVSASPAGQRHGSDREERGESYSNPRYYLPAAS